MALFANDTLVNGATAVYAVGLTVVTLQSLRHNRGIRQALKATEYERALALRQKLSALSWCGVGFTAIFLVLRHLGVSHLTVSEDIFPMQIPGTLLIFADNKIAYLLNPAQRYLPQPRMTVAEEQRRFARIRTRFLTTAKTNNGQLSQDRLSIKKITRR